MLKSGNRSDKATKQALNAKGAKMTESELKAKYVRFKRAGIDEDTKKQLFRVEFVAGVQSFSITTCAYPSDDAEWIGDMFVKALQKVIKENK